MIVFDHVGKRYRSWRGRDVLALEEFSVEIGAGEVFGIAGPNGAGKSTLISLLLGFLGPSTGALHIQGLAPRRYVERHGVGYLSELVNIPPAWRVTSVLRRYGLLAGVAAPRLDERVEWALDSLGLQEHSGTRVRQLSKGNLQRLGLAQALLGDTRMIVLDEPTHGLDPLWTQRFRDIVDRLRRPDRAILIASHNLERLSGCARGGGKRVRDHGTPARRHQRPPRTPHRGWREGAGALPRPLRAGAAVPRGHRRGRRHHIPGAPMTSMPDALATPDHAPDPEPERHGVRLGAYALWQARDYFVDRGTPTVLIGALFGYMVGGPMMASLHVRLAGMSPAALARAGGPDAARAVLVADLTSTFITMLLGNLVFLGALFATNGIVANDRKLGYYRFLCSKPLAPLRYYGQAFFVHWGGFLVMTSLLGLLYRALVGPILSMPLLVAAALMYLCYAGIAFALSAAARWDWLSLVAVTVASNFLWLRYAASTSAFTALLYLLPPIHRTNEVYAAVAGGTALPWALLAWYAVYGAIAFGIGLVVLRHRRLAII